MNLEEKAAPDDAATPQQTTVLPHTQNNASRYPDQRFHLTLCAILGAILGNDARAAAVIGHKLVLFINAHRAEAAPDTQRARG